MQETLRQEDPLDKEMATRSSILAWKIPHSLIFCSFYKVMIMVDNQEESIKKENDCYLCMCVLSCLTLCNPMDYSLPGSSAHVTFQARILE